MGLAKHFHTMKQQGQRVPNYVYRFFQDPLPTDNAIPPEQRRYTPKKKKVVGDKSMDDILKDLLG